jgi:hypothetical protein
MSGVQKSFGRNATNVEASTTEGASFLNANSFESSLTSLDGSNVT